MGTLTVSSDLMAVLKNVAQQTELYDTDGNLIGLYTPVAVIDPEHYEQIKRLVDQNEIKRRKAAEKGVHTTQEILQRLRATEPTQ